MVRRMHWLETGAQHYNTQLGLLEKGRTIRGLVVGNNWDVIGFGHAKRSGPTLSSTAPRGMNRKNINTKSFSLLLMFIFQNPGVPSLDEI